MSIKLSQIDVRSTKEIKLPTSGVQVTLYTSLLWGASNKINQDDPMETGRLLLVDLIKEWDIVDDDEKMLSPTIEIIDSLPMKDGVFLMEQVGEISKEMGEKKSA